MSKHPLTIDDLWALPRVGDPAPSPDGLHLVVPVTTYSMEKNTGTTQLWLVPSDATAAGDGGRADSAVPLTSADASSSSPVWSPTGERIAFVRKPGAGAGDAVHHDMPQLYVMPIDGGEAVRVTDLPLGVAEPQWFPDGQRLAFLSEIFLDAPTIEGTAERATEVKDEPVTARVTEDRFYRNWDHWVTDERRHHVFVVELETRELLDVTPKLKGRFDIAFLSGSLAVAPDGREVAFSACCSKPPHDPVCWGIFTAPVPARIGTGARGARDRSILPREFGQARGGPRYSSDGAWIIFGAARDPIGWAERVRLVAFERATAEHAVLTDRWDRSPGAWTFDERDRQVLCTSDVEGRSGIYAIKFRSAVRRSPATLDEQCRGGTFSGLRVAGGRVFTTEATLRRPAEVVSFALDGSDRRTVTGFTTPVLRHVQLGRVQESSFRGAEGRRVQMILVHPPAPPGAKKKTGKTRRRKPPLVHLVHGGPHGAFGDGWTFRWNAQLFAAQGYLVALVNFHGSTGWGEEFTRSIVGEWGDKPYQDVMAATDALIERDLVDPKRMAATGASYGGYLTSWIASQTDRFRCIVNHAGVCDFQTQFASDIPQGWPRSAGGDLWSDLDGLDRYNPIRHADGFRSPMLVIHGERDYRVPYDQGLQIYNVYKALKRPARLVVYPDENHWILKPRNSQHWYGEVFDWLKRWL